MVHPTVSHLGVRCDVGLPWHAVILSHLAGLRQAAAIATYIVDGKAFFFWHTMRRSETDTAIAFARKRGAGWLLLGVAPAGLLGDRGWGS